VYGNGKFPRMAVAAMENALSLHKDSIHLFGRQSFGSALALSVLAAEELGKYRIIEDLLFSSNVTRPWTQAEEQDWLLAAYDHRRKQAAFCGMAEEAIATRTRARIARGALERDKQRGVYVGLPRSGKAIDVGGPISAPRQVSRRAAERQITMVNDCFVTLCIGRWTGEFMLDIDRVYVTLTMRLAGQLIRRWTRMGAQARRFMKQAVAIQLEAGARARSKNRGA